VENPASPVVGLANVRYLVSRTPVAGATERVAEVGGYHIYEYTRTPPRFFMVDRLRAAAGLAEAANLLHEPGFEPARGAIVEAPTNELPLATTAGRTEVVSYAPAHLQVTTRSSGPSFLVASETWYPGWEAMLDGKPTRLYITDVAFRGVAVPAGDHRVDMRFVPRILYRSSLVSAAGALTALGVALKHRPRAASKR